MGESAEHKDKEPKEETKNAEKQPSEKLELESLSGE